MAMRILFVSPYVPSPIRVRPYQWIRSLSRLGHRVRLVMLQPPEDEWVKDFEIRDYCESVEVFPLARTRTLFNALSAVPQRVPLQAAYSHHPAAERRIAALAAECDVVHVEHLRGSLLATRVRGVPRVLDAVDSIAALFEQTRSQGPTWRHRLMAQLDLRRTRTFEAALPTRFERVVVTSTRDAAAFSSLAGAGADPRIVAVPNGVDLQYFQPVETERDAATILFTGKMSYHANEAAALRLVERVMPEVWKQRPDARVVLAGKDPSPAVLSLSSDPRVRVTGFVDDLRPFFWSASVVAAPLVYGTGIQNKVLEAMACGTPVVASPKACEGIQAVNGRDLMIGRDDRELAALTLALLEDGGLRSQLSREARRYVTVHHDWSEMAARLVHAYEAAISDTRLHAAQTRVA
jgi:sugar transferase (PEP-CTERM/EpsH1 system associated)